MRTGGTVIAAYFLQVAALAAVGIAVGLVAGAALPWALAAAVADQLEVRDVATVEVSVDRSLALTLLFDPEHALDERISMEQFAA